MAKAGGLLTFGVLAIALAAAGPALAKDRTSAFQEKAQAALARLQAKNAAFSEAQAAQAQTQTSLPLNKQAQRLLERSQQDQQDALRYYEAGEYRQAAHAAERANRQLSRATQTDYRPLRTKTKPEVR